LRGANFPKIICQLEDFYNTCGEPKFSKQVNVSRLHREERKTTVTAIIPHGYQLAKSLEEAAETLGLIAYISSKGNKGYHVWVFVAGVVYWQSIKWVFWRSHSKPTMKPEKGDLNFRSPQLNLF